MRVPADAGPSAVVRACGTRALRELPRLNGAYRDGAFETYSRINVGVVARRPATRPSCRRSSTPTARTARRSRAELRAPGRPAPRRGELDVAGARRAARSRSSPPRSGRSCAVRRGPEPGPGRGTRARAGHGTRPGRDGEVVAAAALTATLSCDGRMISGARGRAVPRPGPCAARGLRKAASRERGGARTRTMPHPIIDVPIESLPFVDEHLHRDRRHARAGLGRADRGRRGHRRGPLRAPSGRARARLRPDRGEGRGRGHRLDGPRASSSRAPSARRCSR